jgi:hypothetical protein
VAAISAPVFADLNLIGTYWSKEKVCLRALKPRIYTALGLVLVHTFASITSTDIQVGLQHCS